MKTIEREFTSARAADLLGQHLNDGRHYGHLLADMRRGRRAARIACHYKRVGGHEQAFYYEMDLLAWIERERVRGLRMRPKFEHVEIDDDDFVDLLDIVGLV